jgi:hypothetical protein
MRTATTEGTEFTGKDTEKEILCVTSVPAVVKLL